MKLNVLAQVLESGSFPGTGRLASLLLSMMYSAVVIDAFDDHQCLFYSPWLFWGEGDSLPLSLLFRPP